MRKREREREKKEIIYQPYSKHTKQPKVNYSSAHKPALPAFWNPLTTASNREVSCKTSSFPAVAVVVVVVVAAAAAAAVVAAVADGVFAAVAETQQTSSPQS